MRFCVHAAPLLVLTMAAPFAQGVIVDRVAITVGNKVITESEILRRIRLTAFQNDEKPDFSVAAKRAAAKELIDQKLVEREMDVGRYPHAAPGTGKTLAEDYAKTSYKSDRTAMDAALGKYGLTEHDLEEELTLQSEMLTFLDLRFRPAVQVTDDDVVKYFSEHAPPGERPSTLNEMRAAIEQKLTSARAARELETWLEEQRVSTKIEYNDKDLEDAPAR